MLVFARLKVRTRLLILSLASLFGLIFLTLIALAVLQYNLVEDRKQKTRHLVESTLGVLHYYYQQQQTGQLSEQAAKHHAAETIRQLRYDQREYFWINDTQHRVVMHPIKPEFEGKDQSNLKDPHGVAIYREVVKAALRHPNGDFVHYVWFKPNETMPTAKVSFVRLFAPWQWVVGTGIYLDDVEQVLYHEGLKNLLAVFGGVLVLGSLSVLITRSITRQLGGEPSYVAEVAGYVAAGDLTYPVQVQGNDQGSLLHHTRQMQQGLHTIAREIVLDTSAMNSHMAQVAQASQDIFSASQRSASAATDTSAAVQELTVSIHEIAEVARSTEANSSHTVELALNGTQQAQQARRDIDQIATCVQQAAAQIELLRQRTQEIGQISNVIRDIAEQTNLLALNAAIEAARAGETGRGFAVVADEVRKLAERTAQATAEIDRMIHTVQEETQSAVKHMASATPLVTQGRHSTEAIDQLLTEIQADAANTLSCVRDLTSATREQGIAANQIAQHVEAIAQMLAQTNSATANTNEVTQALAQLSDRLRQTVSQFKTHASA